MAYGRWVSLPPVSDAERKCLSDIAFYVPVRPWFLQLTPVEESLLAKGLVRLDNGWHGLNDYWRITPHGRWVLQGFAGYFTTE